MMNVMDVDCVCFSRCGSGGLWRCFFTEGFERITEV